VTPPCVLIKLVAGHQPTGDIGRLQERALRRKMSDQISAHSAKVTVSGPGAASVYARQRLVAEISGTGSIAVYGNPRRAARRSTVRYHYATAARRQP
jgi:hypothetical protein